MATAYAIEGLGLSERRACLLTGCHPRSIGTDQSGVMMMPCAGGCVSLPGRGSVLAVPGCTSC